MVLKTMDDRGQNSYSMLPDINDKSESKGGKAWGNNIMNEKRMSREGEQRGYGGDRGGMSRLIRKGKQVGYTNMMDLEKILNNRIKNTLKLDSVSMVNNCYSNEKENSVNACKSLIKSQVIVSRRKTANSIPTLPYSSRTPSVNHHLARSNILSHE